MEEITAEARQLIEKIREILEPHEDILTVYLFGSAVKNRLRVDSDIDIAVAGKSIFTFDQKLEIANVLTKNLHREIDCIDLKAENGLLMYEILTKGKRVFAKDKKLTLELMNKTVYFAEDFLPSIKMLLSRRVQRFVNG